MIEREAFVGIEHQRLLAGAVAVIDGARPWTCAVIVRESREPTEALSLDQSHVVAEGDGWRLVLWENTVQRRKKQDGQPAVAVAVAGFDIGVNDDLQIDSVVKVLNVKRKQRLQVGDVRRLLNREAEVDPDAVGQLLLDVGQKAVQVLSDAVEKAFSAGAG